MFHVCQEDGRHFKFLCPNGTIFNQELLVCDWWYESDCSLADAYHDFRRSKVDVEKNQDSNRLDKVNIMGFVIHTFHKVSIFWSQLSLF